MDREMMVKFLCVALVAAVVLPAGRALYPYLSGDVTNLEFNAIQAVVSATIGFGISTIFG